MAKISFPNPESADTNDDKTPSSWSSTMLSRIGAVSKKINAGVSRISKMLIDEETLPGLKSAENSLLEQAKTEKYIPSLKQALLMASLATPGLAMNPQAPGLDTWLFIVGVSTGSAWFFITLEKVRKQLLDYGVAMTTDMLQAFLTVTLISLFRSGTSILRGQQHDEIAQNEFLQVTTAGITCAVLGRCTWLLIKAVLKFDIMDTFNNGTAPLAKKFYEMTLSGLRKGSERLDYPSVSDEHAMAATADALMGFYQYCLATDSGIDTAIGKEVHSLNTNKHSYKEFFRTVLPLLHRITESYRERIETADNQDTSMAYECQIICQNLQDLQSHIGSQEEVSANYVNVRVAKVLRFLSSCLENFESDIGKGLMTPNDTTAIDASMA